MNYKLLSLLYRLLLGVYFYIYKYVYYWVIKSKKLNQYYYRIGSDKVFEPRLSGLYDKSLDRFDDKSNDKPFWFHAVSGGEVILVDKLIQKYLTSKRVVVSYMSESANELANKLFKANSKITYFYLPLDKKRVMTKLVRGIKPAKFFVIEHDAWPNLLQVLKSYDVPRYMLNFNFKQKDFFRFKRFTKIFSFTHQFDFFFTQNEESYKKVKFFTANRFSPQFKLENLGNIKYNFVSAKKLGSLPALKIPLVVLASSHPKEEEIVTQALLNLIKEKKIKLVIIPRHIERSNEILSVQKKKYSFLNCRVVSDYRKIVQDEDIFIVKEYGVLQSVYQLAKINLIGDSFAHSQGGHNILESIIFKKATLYGEYFKSFPELTEEIEEEFSEIRLEKNQIQKQVIRLLEDPIYHDKLVNFSYKKLNSLKCDEKKLLNIFTND